MITYIDNVQEQLGTTDTTVYTCPTTAKSAHIQFGNATNKLGSVATITVNIVQSGGSVATTNEYAIKAIDSGASDNLYEVVGAILKAGDFVSCKASDASAINFKLGIKEIY